MGDDGGDVGRRPPPDAALGAQPRRRPTRSTREHTNDVVPAGFTLPEQLLATADLEKAVAHAELLIVGVPTTAVRSTLDRRRAWIHPWIPVVSLAKGLEQEIAAADDAGHRRRAAGPPGGRAHRAEHRPRDHEPARPRRA